MGGQRQALTDSCSDLSHPCQSSPVRRKWTRPRVTQPVGEEPEPKLSSANLAGSWAVWEGWQAGSAFRGRQADLCPSVLPSVCPSIMVAADLAFPFWWLLEWPEGGDRETLGSTTAHKSPPSTQALYISRLGWGPLLHRNTLPAWIVGGSLLHRLHISCQNQGETPPNPKPKSSPGAQPPAPVSTPQSQVPLPALYHYDLP